jgi:hypothetical protein
LSFSLYPIAARKIAGSGFFWGVVAFFATTERIILKHTK